MSRTRRCHVSMLDVVEHWRDHLDEFTDHRLAVYGFGEPMCFGCYWLAPVSDTGGSRKSWPRATSWLDRAHLVDHARGGPDEPANIVALCHLCHDVMPSFGDRGAALTWVDQRPDGEPTWQWWTDARFMGRGGLASRASVYRARAAYLEKVRELDAHLRARVPPSRHYAEVAA